MLVPDLRHLTLDLTSHMSDEDQIGLEQLKILLKQLPQLTELTLKCNQQLMPLINDLEYLISDSLPLLRKFQFLFNLKDLPATLSVDDLLRPFESDFWLKQKRWFVRCDSENHDTQLYTIPLIEHESIINRTATTFISKATSTFDCYVNIKSLDIPLNNVIIQSFQDRYYSNIDTLSLSSIGKEISIVDELNRFMNLTTVQYLMIGDDIDTEQFRQLLASLSHMNSLTIDFKQLASFPDDLFFILNRMLKQLNTFEDTVIDVSKLE
ncbi:unnamed protein product, partial [Didymodactylos carnosus]